MTTALAIQKSVVHVTVGVLAGSSLEALMPTFAASSSTATQVFEALVQISLNGVLLSVLGPTLGKDDPTHGLPFSLGFFEAQPALKKRIELLALLARQKASVISPQMVSLAPTEASPTPGS